jgi:cell wall-associated NlpC family hydrolase
MLVFILATQLSAGVSLQPSPLPGPALVTTSITAAQPTDDVRLAEASWGLSPDTPLPALMVAVAERFIGRPYVENSLNVGVPRAGVPEPLVSRLDGFDCVTLVEASLAIARSISLGDPSPAAYRHELEGLRYRNGVRSDFASRLHYFSEWISDNARRGHLVELTPTLGGVPDSRPLTFMSAHASAYPSLADAGLAAGIREVEAALSQRSRSIIPMERAAEILPELQPGDILAFTTRIPGLDVVHTGMVARGPGGALHLLHAPEPGEPVTISSKPLAQYFGASKRHAGIMVARPLPPAR